MLGGLGTPRPPVPCLLYDQLGPVTPQDLEAVLAAAEPEGRQGLLGLVVPQTL